MSTAPRLIASLTSLTSGKFLRITPLALRPQLSEDNWWARDEMSTSTLSTLTVTHTHTHTYTYTIRTHQIYTSTPHTHTCHWSGLVWSQHKRLFQAIAVSKELGSWTCILASRCICRNEPRFGVRSTFQIGLKRDRW